MGEIIYRPPRPHVCRPGWVEVEVSAEDARAIFGAPGPITEIRPDPALFRADPGTVWRCDCGREWVALPRIPGTMYARWGRPLPSLRRWWIELRRKRRERQERNRQCPK